MNYRFRGVMGLVTLVAGCARSAPASRFPVEHIDVPERVADYTSEPRPDGAMGGRGAAELAEKVAQALASRGQRAQADGALAGAACWGLSRVHQGHQPNPPMIDAAARHFGFGGVISSYAAFDTQTDLWREQLDRVPANMVLNRFGVCTSPSGRSAEVVLGALEMEYQTVPRDFEVEQQVTIRGRLTGRYTSGHVYLTKPDGTVEEQRASSTSVDVTFPLPTLGAYRLEVMGDGPSGPVIVSNLPLYVGVAEPPIRESTGAVVEPDVAEARMLELLNETRKAAGVAPVATDAELRKVAAGHTEDMVDHHFFSHVSPSTGAPGDRARRAGLVVSQFGENIAAAPTPEDAHAGLMDSPGHRANMLNPAFTHVGIAAANGDTGLVVTLNFGRRPRPEDLPSPAQVEAAVRELRTASGLATPVADPVYRAAAQAGADAMAAGDDLDDVAKAESQAMQREVDRLHTSRAGSCTMRLDLLEVAQLKQASLLLSPQIRRLAIGTHLRKDAHGARLATVIMVEGVPCR